MAFIFADGFDHYTITNDRHLDKWDRETTTSSFSINSGTGQGGSDSGRFTSAVSLVKNITESTTLIFGFWIKYSGTSTSTSCRFLRFFNDGTEMCQLGYSAGKLVFFDDASFEYNVPNVSLRSGREYYIEGKIVFDETEGSVEIRVDGQTQMTRTGIDTAADSINEVYFGTSSGISTCDLDDFYLLDDTGSTFNDFLGPIRIETLFPNANGTTNAWDNVTGPSNYQDVDDNPPDDDTTYVSTSTTTEVDLYAFGNLSTTSGSIDGVIVTNYARKDGTTARTIDFAVRQNGVQVDNVGNLGLKEVYKFNQHLFEQNPDGPTAWSVTTVNAAEFGQKLNS